MTDAGLVLLAVPAVVGTCLLAMVLYSYRVVPRLGDFEPATSGPRVSIIVAARDEERHIRAAVASLLAQNYHDVELIVVQDRSADRTGAILDAMAAKTERLIVEHVVDLPDGWLGKNHALHRGAARATGELLLFVDGDIMLERTAVSRAVRVFLDGADHVTVAPQMDLPTWPTQLLVGFFLTWGVAATRVWQVANPRRRTSIGIGAFNMVRATSYKEVGGHTRIAMRPDDDLMLGKLLKDSGARSRVLFGIEYVAVEWYRSVREARIGFRKNAYAALRYSFALFVLAVAASLAVGILPFVLVFLTDGPALGFCAVAIVTQLAAYARTCAEQRFPVWLTLLYPVGCLLQTALLVMAVTRTLATGGIEWRGTFYPLDRLRANRV